MKYGVGSQISFTIFCLAIMLVSTRTAIANGLSAQEILDKLKSHQDKIQTIEAEFAMTVFGVENFKLEQSGTFTYTAPDKAIMTFVKPQPQVVKTEGGKSYISINNAPFKQVPTSEKTGNLGNDLFHYHFLKQFYLDIDTSNKPADSKLYKVLGYHKNEDGFIASSESVLNAKAVELIYDRNRGLITQMNFTGSGPMPPVEVKQVYEEKNGCWVVKGVFSKVITPGGAISSVVKLNNKKVAKK